MSPTREQRAMMAAHLYDLASLMVRRGEGDDAPEVGRWAESVLHFDAVGEHYRDGLESAGLSPADIDAAVAAIARGEHPADSLPGMVVTYEREVKCGLGPSNGEHARGFTAGRVSAARWVLDLLGCKVTP